ncbi:MAG: zinc ribbon domain-containing protein [Isosphaeraceae bacterium]
MLSQPRCKNRPATSVDPRNTSRTCSECGHCEKANRKSQAVFLCKHCGFSANADGNAARNIAFLALGASRSSTGLVGQRSLPTVRLNRKSPRLSYQLHIGRKPLWPQGWHGSNPGFFR